jgi:Tfp pilus assembly protein PilO
MKTNTTNWRYIYATHRFMIFAGVVVTLGILTLALVFWPQLQSALASWDKIQTEQKLLSELKKKDAGLREFSSGFNQTQVDQVEKALPSKKPLLELLTTLNQVASNTNVVFTGIELSPGSIATNSAQIPKDQPKTKSKAKARASTPSTQEYDTMRIELSVEGKLSQLNAFFAQVEKMAPVTTISSLQLSEAQATSGVTTSSTAGEGPRDLSGELFSADLELTTFYFTKSITATVEAPLPNQDEQQTVLDEVATYIFSELSPQATIQGGGLGDLFGVEELLQEGGAF